MINGNTPGVNFQWVGAVLKVLINNYPPPHMLLRQSRNSICGGGNLLNSTFQTASNKYAVFTRESNGVIVTG